MPRRQDSQDWRRAAARRALLPLGTGVVGAIVVLTGGATATIVGWGIIGVAVTVAISLFFLEVGYSEDRDRARDVSSR